MVGRGSPNEVIYGLMGAFDESIALGMVWRFMYHAAVMYFFQLVPHDAHKFGTAVASNPGWCAKVCNASLH